MTQACPIPILKEVAQNQLTPTGTTVLLVITGTVDLISNPETWHNHELFTWKMKTDCMLPLQGQLQENPRQCSDRKDKMVKSNFLPCNHKKISKCYYRNE